MYLYEKNFLLLPIQALSCLLYERTTVSMCCEIFIDLKKKITLDWYTQKRRELGV